MVGPVSRSLQAKAVVDGAACGTVLALDEPLSFWGGVDPATGVIVDRHHPQADASVAGTVLWCKNASMASCSGLIIHLARNAG